MTQLTKGGREVSQLLTITDKGGSGGLDPPQKWFLISNHLHTIVIKLKGENKFKSTVNGLQLVIYLTLVLLIQGYF